MDKSESVKELAAALSIAQGQMPAVPMGSVNPFLHNKYANLGDVIKTAQPILAKNGLSYSQSVYTDSGQLGVETIIMHASGEWLSSKMSLAVGDPEKGLSSAQSAGKVITYLRRYTLSAMLGVYADEDADGSEQTKSTAKPAPAAPRTSQQPAAEVIDQLDRDFPPVVTEAKYLAACEVTASDGVRYGDRETDKLVWVANNAKSPAEKKAAANTIIAWRNAHPSA